MPKTRSVMGGNDGGNAGIREFISLVLEPVAREQDGNMEINATNCLLADIDDLNAELDEERKTHEVSSPQEELPTLQEEVSSHLEDPLCDVQKPRMASSLEEHCVHKNSQEVERMSGTGGACHLLNSFCVKFIKKLSNGLIDIQLIVPPNFFEF